MADQKEEIVDDDKEERISELMNSPGLTFAGAKARMRTYSNGSDISAPKSPEMSFSPPIFVHLLPTLAVDSDVPANFVGGRRRSSFKAAIKSTLAAGKHMNVSFNGKDDYEQLSIEAKKFPHLEGAELLGAVMASQDISLHPEDNQNYGESSDRGRASNAGLYGSNIKGDLNNGHKFQSKSSMGSAASGDG